MTVAPNKWICRTSFRNGANFERAAPFRRRHVRFLTPPVARLFLATRYLYLTNSASGAVIKSRFNRRIPRRLSSYSPAAVYFFTAPPGMIVASLIRAFTAQSEACARRRAGNVSGGSRQYFRQTTERQLGNAKRLCNNTFGLIG